MKPILFNTDMVRAILDGRKTVTRRVIKKPYEVHPNGVITKPKGNERLCPYEPPYKVGDILYVRETFVQAAAHIFWYKADNKEFLSKCKAWKPSIHMPKEAARLFLKVTDIRVEKLRDMALEDFIAEGIKLSREELKDYDNALYKARELFKELWNSTAGKPHTPERYANNFYANPFVWVIEFEVITKEEAQGN